MFSVVNVGWSASADAFTVVADVEGSALAPVVARRAVALWWIRRANIVRASGLRVALVGRGADHAGTAVANATVAGLARCAAGLEHTAYARYCVPEGGGAAGLSEINLLGRQTRAGLDPSAGDFRGEPLDDFAGPVLGRTERVKEIGREP